MDTVVSAAKGCGCNQGPVSWGAQPPRRHLLSSSALPQSVRCPKEAKEPSSAGCPARVPALGVPLPSAPSSRGCPCAPVSALLAAGGVALSFYPKLTVNFPNKGQFLHARGLFIPRAGVCSPGLSPLLSHTRGCSRSCLIWGAKGVFLQLCMGGSSLHSRSYWLGGDPMTRSVPLGARSPPWGTEPGASGPCLGRGESWAHIPCLRGEPAACRPSPGRTRGPPGRARGLCPGTGVTPAAPSAGAPGCTKPPSPPCPAALICISPPPPPISQSAAAAGVAWPMGARVAHLLAPATGAPGGRGWRSDRRAAHE